jgi:LPS sulfotransferase NodH
LIFRFSIHVWTPPQPAAFSQSLRDCQREIARTRESATAAKGGTHVYLNRKMMQEFTFLLAEIGITFPALSGDTVRP